jgi:hypothetical protein
LTANSIRSHHSILLILVAAAVLVVMFAAAAVLDPLHRATHSTHQTSQAHLPPLRSDLGVTSGGLPCFYGDPEPLGFIQKVSSAFDASSEVQTQLPVPSFSIITPPPTSPIVLSSSIGVPTSLVLAPQSTDPARNSLSAVRAIVGVIDAGMVTTPSSNPSFRSCANDFSDNPKAAKLAHAALAALPLLGVQVTSLAGTPAFLISDDPLDAGSAIVTVRLPVGSYSCGTGFPSGSMCANVASYAVVMSTASLTPTALGRAPW